MANEFDHRDQEPEPDNIPDVDPEYIEAVEAHVTRTVGEQNDLFHEIISPYVHIDVLQVPPDQGRPWTTLVTCGMGSRAMRIPRDAGAFERIELAVCLPPKWPPIASEQVGMPGPGAWIVDYLRFLARLPFQYGTWFATGHTIPNGDPAEPFRPKSRLCCAMLARPRRIKNPQFKELTLRDGKKVRFLAIVFLTMEEMKYKLRHGALALQKKLAEGKVDELVKLYRPSVCSGGWIEHFFG